MGVRQGFFFYPVSKDIKQQDHVSNEDLYVKVEERQLSLVEKERQLHFLGPVAQEGSSRQISPADPGTRSTLREGGG